MTEQTPPQIRNSKHLRRLLGLSKDVKLPKVFLIAHISDQATGEAFFEVGFQSEGRKWKSIRVPKEDVRHYPTKTRDRLSKYDALLPRDQKKIEALMQELARYDAPNWWRIAQTLGWQDGGAAFALNNRVLGENGDGRSNTATKLIPPDKNANAHMAMLKKTGDLESWKKEVAEFARWSSPVALALSAAFAAPLLSVVEWPTFMLVIYGPGKVGKSTGALAGATVVGIGLEADLPNWNVTPAALPEIACCFNDQLLVLNGLETTKLKEKELSEFLRGVTYMLGDGIEMRRHSSWSAAHGKRGPAAWRTIVLVTSEKSFDEIAASANDSRLDGERARSINIAAIDAGASTIIDIFPEDAPKGAVERLSWARGQVEALRSACARHHGVALQPYLKHLIKKDREKLKEEILAARDTFVTEVKDLTTTEALNHAAKNMGLVYAGGVQAIQAGLLPLTEKKLLKRISKCFKRSVNAATTGDPLMLALRRFDEGLRVAIAAADTPEIAPRMAIAKNKNGRGVDEFTVHVKELFSKWFDDQRHLAAVLRWLNNEGLLEVRDRDAAVREGFTIESVRLTRRIQGKNCATVVFRDPRPRLKQVLGSYAPFPAALPIIKP